MSIPQKLLAAAVSIILANPTAAGGTVIFTTGFAFIASNAIYGQAENHPSPIYQAPEKTARRGNTENPVKPVRVEKAPVATTHRVLTQRISLKNIPIPTANPARQVPVSSHSSLVRDVQSALAAVGLYEGKIDGIFGSGTRQAIIGFQERAGILPTGEASYDLLSGIRSAGAVAQLQQEVSSETVSAVQTDSIRQPKLLVFDTETVARIQTGLRDNFAEDGISVDGLLGNQTKSAIRRFQERFKLEASGELNEETMQKLVSVGIINSI